MPYHRVIISCNWWKKHYRGLDLWHSHRYPPVSLLTACLVQDKPYHPGLDHCGPLNSHLLLSRCQLLLFSNTLLVFLVKVRRCNTLKSLAQNLRISSRLHENTPPPRMCEGARGRPGASVPGATDWGSRLWMNKLVPSPTWQVVLNIILPVRLSPHLVSSFSSLVAIILVQAFISSCLNSWNK